METALAITGWTLFVILILTGVALNAVGLWGSWVILVTVAGAWLLSGFEHFSILCLVILTLLATAGEILESVAASYGATRFGGSRKAFLTIVAGGILGAIAGTPILPIIGSLAGAIAGAFIAAALYEFIVMERSTGASLWTGVGAVLGRLAGAFAKLLVAVFMLITAYIFF